MEKIALLGTTRKYGRWINKMEYEKFYELILAELSLKYEVRLQELLDIAAIRMAREFPINFSWLLLQVKHDMEARGIIQSKLDNMRNQVIKMKEREKVMETFAGARSIPFH
jgi:hypothetical protein